MALIAPPYTIPPPLAPLRSVRNGDRVQAAYSRQLLNLLNHGIVHRRKNVYSHYTALNTLPAVAAGTITTQRCYVRTGEDGGGSGVFLRFVTLLAPAGNASATDPYAYWEITPVGSSAVNSNEMHYGPHQSSFGPDDLQQFVVEYDAAPDTRYEIALKQVDYCQVVGASIYEWVPSQVDTTATYASDPSGIIVGNQMDDAQHNDLVQNPYALWRHNASHLFSWSVDEDPDNSGNAPQRSSATYANAFDQTQTAFGAGDPGVKLQTRYHSPAHATSTTTCVFAAYGKTASGSAGKVKLIDTNGDLCSITNFDTTAAWKTAALTLDGSADGQECQLYIAGDGTNSFTLYAVSIYEYVT